MYSVQGKLHLQPPVAKKYSVHVYLYICTGIVTRGPQPPVSTLWYIYIHIYCTVNPVPTVQCEPIKPILPSLQWLPSSATSGTPCSSCTRSRGAGTRRDLEAWTVHQPGIQIFTRYSSRSAPWALFTILFIFTIKLVSELILNYIQILSPSPKFNILWTQLRQRKKIPAYPWSHWLENNQLHSLQPRSS